MDATQTPNPMELNPVGRGLLLGQTRSGKTTLAEYLLIGKRNLVIIDPKHQFNPPFEQSIVYDPDELPDAARRIYKIQKEHPNRLIAINYRPSIDALEDSDIDRVLRWIFNRENTLVYVDELTAIVKGPQSYPRGLRAIYTMGGSKNVGILAGTQRPSYLPRFVFSETDTFWQFYLGLQDDRETAAEWMNPPSEDGRRARALINSEKYSFWFYQQGMTGPQQYKLQLGGGRK
jgi:hypothetical protein